MATDSLVPTGRPPPMTVADLVAYTKKELEAEASEKQAKLLAASVGELPKDSHDDGATLDLSRRNISALPVEVIELIKDKVERLALSHNPSVTLPSQIVQCERIRYLNIRWNDLDRFPEVILRLTQLEILDLSKNNIEVIPEGIRNMTSLKFLAVARNRIRRLPLALGDMPSLQKLKYDENPIEFPPPDAIKLPKKQVGSSLETEREKEVCRLVKNYLKEITVKQKMKADEELSESNAETPRPPKRTATIGRFPIRPSISGLPNGLDLKSSSPSDFPPPIPQRSHARVTSTASTASTTSLTPPTPKRPGIAPLRSNGNDIVRSRSENAASANIRQRRQGYVPKRERKVTAPLNSLTESPNETPDRGSRTSTASTIKATHSRATSSLSTVSSFLASSEGETSSGSRSPVEIGPGFPVRTRSRTKRTNGTNKSGPPDFLRVAERLAALMRQLQSPISEIMMSIDNGPSTDPTLRLCIASANANGTRIEAMITDARITSTRPPVKAVIQRATDAVESYLAMVAALNRSVPTIAGTADGIYTRCLMSQIYAAVIEARNMCTLLGFQVKERSGQRDTLRPSRTWSSRNITPTQPKTALDRRPQRPTVIPRSDNSSTIRPMAPPLLPLSTNASRTNTITSLSAATPRSNDSFGSLPSATPHLSRANTMRSMMRVMEPDDQFEHIFLKLRYACDQAGQALAACRVEFANRRDQAMSFNQPRPARQWGDALSKCDIASNHNQTLRKRLELVKVNDPHIRFQRDFWQLCDSFVHSWVDLAAEIKDLGCQRVDVTNAKQIMKHVQKLVKDVSKTISASPLYNHAVGTRTQENTVPTSGLAAPFPAGLTSAPPSTTSSFGSSQVGNPYITALPATPLSAALGPAAHAVTPGGGNQVGYFQEPTQLTAIGPHSSARTMHERVDTVMQPPGRQPRRQI